MSEHSSRSTSELRPRASATENSPDFDKDHPLLREKFTVKDMLQMFKLSLQGTLDDEEEEETASSSSSSSSHQLRATRRLEMLLRMLQGLDTQESAESVPPTTRLEPRRSSQIVADHSDSATLQNLFAVSERVLEKKEVLVHPVVRAAYRRLLDFKVLPNSTLRKLPDTPPPPKPTWHQEMQRKVMQKYYDYYGPDKPRPNFPILPPRKDQQGDSEPDPKGKKENERKGREGKEGTSRP